VEVRERAGPLAVVLPVAVVPVVERLRGAAVPVAVVPVGGEPVAEVGVAGVSLAGVPGAWEVSAERPLADGPAAA
jgi:hypothetical protein